MIRISSFILPDCNTGTTDPVPVFLVICGTKRVAVIRDRVCHNRKFRYICGNIRPCVIHHVIADDVRCVYLYTLLRLLHQDAHLIPCCRLLRPGMDWIRDQHDLVSYNRILLKVRVCDCIFLCIVISGKCRLHIFLRLLDGFPVGKFLFVMEIFTILLTPDRLKINKQLVHGTICLRILTDNQHITVVILMSRELTKEIIVRVSSAKDVCFPICDQIFVMHAPHHLPRF